MFTDSQRRRLAAKAKLIGRQGLFEMNPLVTPDTLLRWYRTLIAKQYGGSAVCGPGRPKTAVEIEQLILRMVRSNPSWGYTRIRGALYNLGHEIAEIRLSGSYSTTVSILLRFGTNECHGRHFSRAHWGAIAATDFFSVEVLTRKGIVRYFVLFIIDLQSRRVEIAGIVQQPDGQWMRQIAHNLTDVDDGLLIECRYLIHDRDPLFTEGFSTLLKSADVETIKLPARSPNLNVYAERFVRSIKYECLGRMLPLGERHLRDAVAEYVDSLSSGT